MLTERLSGGPLAQRPGATVLVVPRQAEVLDLGAQVSLPVEEPTGDARCQRDCGEADRLTARIKTAQRLDGTSPRIDVPLVRRCQERFESVRIGHRRCLATWIPAW